MITTDHFVTLSDAAKEAAAAHLILDTYNSDPTSHLSRLDSQTAFTDAIQRTQELINSLERELDVLVQSRAAVPDQAGTRVQP